MKIFQPFSGASCLITGFTLLLQPGIRRYIILPLLINFILFTLFIVLGISHASQLIQDMLPQLPDWLQWIEWLIWPVFMLSFLAIGFLFSLMMANVIAAPFNGFLAAAVEKKLHPGSFSEEISNQSLISQIIASLINEIKKLVYFLVRAVPLLLLFIIPGINLVAPLIWLLFSAWMITLEYIDYPFANHEVSFDEIRRQLKQRRLLGLGFGLATLLLTIIPIVNFFVMPVAVAGATVMYRRHFMPPAP